MMLKESFKSAALLIVILLAALQAFQPDLASPPTKQDILMSHGLAEDTARDLLMAARVAAERTGVDADTLAALTAHAYGNKVARMTNLQLIHLITTQGTQLVEAKKLLRSEQAALAAIASEEGALKVANLEKRLKAIV